MTCQLCDPTITTPTYYAGSRVVVIECDTCAAPYCFLTDHEDDPTLETQAYALGVVRGLFGHGSAFEEPAHGTPEGHWNAHVDVPTG